jgi:hypothetical protein
LAGVLRAGNAGSNTAADQVTVLEGVPAAGLALRPAQSRGAEGGGAVGLGRGHPRRRQSLPRPPGRILLRSPGRRPCAGRRGHPQPWRRLVPGDRHRRRDPRRGVGGRGHRPGRLVRLACPDPVDPAHGAPAPRRAAAVHRRRPRSSQTHRPASSRGSWPGSSCGTVNTPASRTASATARRPGWPTCPARASTPTLPGSKSSWPQPISSSEQN